MKPKRKRQGNDELQLGWNKCRKLTLVAGGSSCKLRIHLRVVGLSPCSVCGSLVGTPQEPLSTARRRVVWLQVCARGTFQAIYIPFVNLPHQHGVLTARKEL